MMNTDYCLERRLSMLDTELHRRYKDCVLTSQTMLTRYQSVFPEYTDHTILHTMNVTDFCNRLIDEQVYSLTADAIYVLLMGCLFHDVGMGVSLEDYKNFMLQLDNQPSSLALDEDIRNFHNEFSALYLEKYWKLLDIPNKTYLFAIMQVAKGHRKTELMHEEDYPATYLVGNGSSVCLPYLAAVLRLADELDISDERNTVLMYDIDMIKDPISHMEFSKHKAIRSVEMDEHTITLCAQSNDPVIRSALMLIREKIEETLHYCRMVAANRSAFVITQQTVQLVMNNAN
ncbi:MAG: HD domain-containing protein [Ruthenibacterium sp.]